MTITELSITELKAVALDLVGGLTIRDLHSSETPIEAFEAAGVPVHTWLSTKQHHWSAVLHIPRTGWFVISFDPLADGSGKAWTERPELRSELLLRAIIRAIVGPVSDFDGAVTALANEGTPPGLLDIGITTWVSGEPLTALLESLPADQRAAHLTLLGLTVPHIQDALVRWETWRAHSGSDWDWKAKNATAKRGWAAAKKARWPYMYADLTLDEIAEESKVWTESMLLLQFQEKDWPAKAGLVMDALFRQDAPPEIYYELARRWTTWNTERGVEVVWHEFDPDIDYANLARVS